MLAPVAVPPSLSKANVVMTTPTSSTNVQPATASTLGNSDNTSVMTDRNLDDRIKAPANDQLARAIAKVQKLESNNRQLQKDLTIYKASKARTAERAERRRSLTNVRKRVEKAYFDEHGGELAAGKAELMSAQARAAKAICRLAKATAAYKEMQSQKDSFFYQVDGYSPMLTVPSDFDYNRLMPRGRIKVTGNVTDETLAAYASAAADAVRRLNPFEAKYEDSPDESMDTGDEQRSDHEE